MNFIVLISISAVALITYGFLNSKYQFICCGILLVLGFIIGHFAGRKTIETEAVKSGAAYYSSDEDGEAKLYWKYNQENKQFP